MYILGFANHEIKLRILCRHLQQERKLENKFPILIDEIQKHSKSFVTNFCHTGVLMSKMELFSGDNILLN